MTLFVIATVIAVSAFNILAASHMPLTEGILATLHVFAFVPIVVSLLGMAPKVSARTVFFSFTDYGGGWPHIALSALVGQGSCMFVVLGSDAVAQLVEEVESVGAVIPNGMVWGFLLNVLPTFIMLLTFCFCIGSVEEALRPPYPCTFFQSLLQPQLLTFSN